MSYQEPAHRSIAWGKQKLDALDALLNELDSSVAGLNGKAKVDAGKALDRIREARDAFRAYIAGAQAEIKNTAITEASKARQVIEEAREFIENEWVDAELAFSVFPIVSCCRRERYSEDTCNTGKSRTERAGRHP